MKKILFVATISSFINAFLVNNIKILNSLGFEIHIAVGKDGDITTKIPEYVKIHYLQIQRSPMNFKNIYAYKELIELVHKFNIDVIDCHTPVGGVLGRLVAHKTGIHCIYTAHGFHFYNGSPLKNWMIFYPIEKWLSKYTDILITINKEDYNRAKNNFHAKQVNYIPGVGVDINEFKKIEVDKDDLKKQLRIPKNNIVIVSIGELSKRKNHELVINSLNGIDNVTYIICGQGDLKDHLNKLALDKKVDLRLLGFRNDRIELLKASDIFVFPSLQEGLPVSLMEAMACGIPCICSNIRGNNDLIENEKSGLLVPLNEKEFSSKLIDLMESKEIRDRLSAEAINKIAFYDISLISEKMKVIYSKINTSI